MAADPVTPRLRPLGIGELLDAAIKVCIANAGTLMKAVLVALVPVQILSAIVLASTVDDAALLDPSTTETPATDAAFLAGQVVVALLGGVAFVLAIGACYRAIAEGWLGRRPNWRESVGYGLRRAPSLLWLLLLLGLGAGLASLALLLPGIWLLVAWSVAAPALFVEDQRGTNALRRSFRLVRDRWWFCFGLLVVGFLLALVVQFIVGLVVAALSFAGDSLGFLILVNVLGGLLAQVVTTPFQAALVVLLYFDLRVRKEGFDLELLADRLGGGAPLAEGTAPPAPASASASAPAGAGAAWSPPAPPVPRGDEPGPSPGEAPPGWLPPGGDPDRG